VLSRQRWRADALLKPMGPDNSANGSPLQYPSIQIGGATYGMRFSFGAELLADQMGLDVKNYYSNLREKSVGRFQATLQMFTCMVSHNFTAVGMPVPTVDTWTQILDGMDPDLASAKYQEIVEKIGQTWRAKNQQATAKLKLQEPAPRTAEGSLQ